MILRLLSSLRVPAAAGIESTIEDERPVIGGSGPHGRVENGPRETLDCEMCLNNYHLTVRTSTRRLPRYWGTTSRAKMICACVFAGAGSRLTIVEGPRRTAGSGLPPRVGNELMLRELETLVLDVGCRFVRQTT